jgi:hypothetical protein
MVTVVASASVEHPESRALSRRRPRPFGLAQPCPDARPSLVAPGTPSCDLSDARSRRHRATSVRNSCGEKPRDHKRSVRAPHKP